MSTPDTPPHDTTPDAPAAGSPAPNEPSQTGDSPRNGASHVEASEVHPGTSDDPSHQPSGGEAAGTSDAAHASHDESGDDGGEAGGDDAHDAHGPEGEGAPHEGGAQAAGGAQPTGEKKRRRRRRRKKGDKPGVHATAEGATETAEGEGAEGGVEGKGEGVKVEGKLDGARPDKREPRREREKKSGPPRERPPVNAGDIVFGKIVEITDDAILIDIPGKAHAIFDRREMLLTDDEDAAAAASSSTRVAEAADAAPEGAGTRAEAPADGGAHEAAVADASAPAPPASLVDLPHAEDAPTPPSDVADVAEVDPVASVEAKPSEGADEATPVAVTPAEPEPPKDPKVPRVILEVGADFIGVVHNDGARGGLVVLTHHPRRLERAKGLVEKASVDKGTVMGLVTGVIKGGIEVDVDGLRAFAPGSHVDLRLGADLSHLVAKRLPFFVTQYAKRGRDVVLSRKSLLEDESRKARSEALGKLKVGEHVDGIVRSVVQFGAFIDIGGIEGLVPLPEMSHNRGDGPSDVFKVGETTRVAVTKIDDRGKVWLSRKATIPDPWQQVAQKYATGTRHAGKVVRLQGFGAFIELEPGVDGLLHTADLSIKRIDSPEEVVKVGDAIDVVVAHVDPMSHKIALHPALQGDAAEEAPQRVGPHKPVKAKVVQIESGGLVVRILGVTGRNARGYVTAAGTGTPRGTELRKVFTVGQMVDAKVIEMDPRRGEVKLSIKALSEDQERSAYQQYRQQLKAEARFTFGDLLAKKGNEKR